ncbi:MAG TPA: hypothetical protein VFA93_00660 [Patescibacteria group bacterium]|nr:hypothetical protein [Patescibacteria group bacterium]
MKEAEGRPELHMVLNESLEIVQLQEPEQVYGSLRAFAGEYGTQDRIEFIRSLDKSLARNSQPLVLSLIGEPVSGKTHVGRDIANVVFKGEDGRESEVAKLEQETGEKVPVYSLYWGDLIALAKLKSKIPNTSSDETNDKDQLKQISSFYGEVLSDLLKNNQGRRCLIITEMVGVTGAYIKDAKSAGGTKFFGYDRGHSTLWKLSSRLNGFSGLRYDVYFLGIAATQQIRERGISFKEKLRKTGNPDEIARVFQESGESFDPSNVSEIEHYAHESLSRKEMEDIEGQTDDLIKEIKKVDPVLFYNLDLEKYESDKNYRFEAIGEMLLRYILERSLRIRKRRAFLAQNHEEIPTIKFNDGKRVVNYIWERYPELRNLRGKPSNP